MKPPWKTVWQVLKKFSIKLPCDPAVLLQGTYPKGLKTEPHKNLYTNIHSSILPNSQKLETTQCPSTDEQIDPRRRDMMATMAHKPAPRSGEPELHAAEEGGESRLPLPVPGQPCGVWSATRARKLIWGDADLHARTRRSRACWGLSFSCAFVHFLSPPPPLPHTREKRKE